MVQLNIREPTKIKCSCKAIIEYYEIYQIPKTCWFCGKQITIK